MRIGQKITFEPVRDFGTLKAGHKYTGYFAGKCFARYHNYIVRAQNMQPVALATAQNVSSITSAQYKAFADCVFEMSARFRCKWRSIISGLKIKKGSYDAMVGGHYIGRNNLATRHLPMNCHAITKDENRAMAHGDARVWEKYRQFLIKEYGQNLYDEMMALKGTTVRLTTPLLIEDCKFCWAELCKYCSAEKEFEDRISKWAKRYKYNQVATADDLRRVLAEITK